MPIGIQRLNDRHPQPSSQIVFIKPLPGPDEAYAKDFLERVAAICHPIMKSNHLSVMTLEEHEANTEFVGRNFNAGEIIQLCLKSYANGKWLSFKTVQMVMMHELAHCNQMNHSRAFWVLRNQYASEVRLLWEKGYSGDGLWGRGRTLLSENYDASRPDQDVLPEQLCGGVYRSSRRRKRKKGTPSRDQKPETYAEQRQRRVAKKFGVAGQILGGDQATRVKLERGQVLKAQPKVANSSRGRELRVAAALARLGGPQEKQSEEDMTKLEHQLFGYCSDSSTEDEPLDATRLTDGQGRDIFRICANEDAGGSLVKQELEEIQGLEAPAPTSSSCINGGAETEDEDVATSFHNEYPVVARSPRHVEPDVNTGGNDTDQELGTCPSSPKIDESMSYPYRRLESASARTQPPKAICPICSMVNEASALCLACSHVLDTNMIRDNWQCENDKCKNGQYVNAGDCGLCGICGSRKPGMHSS